MDWYWVVFSTIVLLVASAALNASLIFGCVWQSRTNRIRQAAQNILLALFAVLVTLILLELFFKLVFAQSDGFNHTLASKNWFNRYWQTNSLGYRDVEWTPAMLEGRTRIMVLGDSFAAGHGINNPNHRFSNLLGQMLGRDYAVMNVSQNGANTKTEIQNAIAYPYPPDIVILSFYVNDIQDTALAMGYNRPDFKTSSPFLVGESYALNFLYWRIFRLQTGNWANAYWRWLAGLYNDPGVWNVYRDELLQIHRFIQDRNGQLIVVVFPNLLAIEESRPVTSKVSRLFTDHGVPVLDVGELVAGMDAEALVVNPVDPHPNEFVHRRVAEALHRLILEQRHPP